MNRQHSVPERLAFPKRSRQYGGPPSQRNFDKLLSSRTFSLAAMLSISAATLFAYGEQVTFGLTDVDVHALILTGVFALFGRR